MNLSGNITGGQVAFDALSCKANSSVLLTFRENFDGFLLVLVFLFGEALKIERGARLQCGDLTLYFGGSTCLCRDSHKYVWKRLDIEVKTA